MGEQAHRDDDSPCPSCGDPEPPMNTSTERCRECELDYLIESGRCESCGNFIFSDFAVRQFGLVNDGHAATCPARSKESTP